MTYKDLSLIDHNWLDEREKDLTELLGVYQLKGDDLQVQIITGEIGQIKQVKSKLIDVTTVLDECWVRGENFGHITTANVISGEYQEPKMNFEQFLETEVKL